MRPQKQLVKLGSGRPPVAYDALSLDIGITPSAQGVPGALQHATPVKPVSRCACVLAWLVIHCNMHLTCKCDTLSLNRKWDMSDERLPGRFTEHRGDQQKMTNLRDCVWVCCSFVERFRQLVQRLKLLERELTVSASPDAKRTYMLALQCIGAGPDS